MELSVGKQYDRSIVPIQNSWCEVALPWFSKRGSLNRPMDEHNGLRGESIPALHSTLLMIDTLEMYNSLPISVIGHHRQLVNGYIIP